LTTVLSESSTSQTIPSGGEIVYGGVGTNLLSGQGSWELHPYDLNYVVFEADGSIRLDPTDGIDDRATWALLLPVTPGQRIVARAEIKTEAISPDYVPPQPWSNGGRIGMDFYSGGQVVRAVELSGIDGYGPWIGGGWVEWGSDWSFRELDNEDTIIQEGEEYTIMWIQAMAHDAPASAWFRNMEFYILNPGENPP
jgi:hypothetical protein